MEKPAHKPLPWAWSALVCAVLLALPLMSYAGSRWIVAKANASELNIDSVTPQMLVWSAAMAVVCLILTAVALRVQARKGIAEPVRWAVSVAVSVGVIVLAVALGLAAMLFDARPGMTAENMVLQFSYLAYQMTTPVMQALAAAVLLPPLRARLNLHGSALWLGAVLFVPQVAISAAFGIPSVQQGASLLPVLWRALALGIVATAWAMAAVASLRAMGQRLWDALALHCGLWTLAMVLSSFLASIGSNWFAEGAWQLLSAAAGLLALACLLMWDRGTSPAQPFIALARRVKALAGHFLPT